MADDPLGPLAGILGLRVRLAHGAIQRHFAENFAQVDLTQKQISLLWLVGEQPGVAQADLARRLQMDRATTMALVHQLERRALIARARSRADARRIGLTLTDAGDTALGHAREAVAQHEAWLRGRFTDREVRQLSEMLTRIFDA